MRVPRCLTIHNCIDSRQRRVHNHTVLYGEPRCAISSCNAPASPVLRRRIHGVLGEPSIRPGDDRAGKPAHPDPPVLAGRHGGLDRRRGAADRNTLDGSERARHWIVTTSVAVYAFAVDANCWWSRGRGFGWKALSVVVVHRGRWLLSVPAPLLGFAPGMVDCQGGRLWNIVSVSKSTKTGGHSPESSREDECARPDDVHRDR